MGICVPFEHLNWTWDLGQPPGVSGGTHKASDRLELKVKDEYSIYNEIN